MRYPPLIVTREARVRREYAHLYDGWDLSSWAPAARVAEWVRARAPKDRAPEPGLRRLPEDQFEFRGGAPRRPGLRARTRRTD
jgi:hypothetical protein